MYVTRKDGRRNASLAIRLLLSNIYPERIKHTTSLVGTNRLTSTTLSGHVESAATQGGQDQEYIGK